MVICVVFLRDVACQKLVKSANVSQSYSRNNTGTVFLRHGVYVGSPATWHKWTHQPPLCTLEGWKA